jgi:hypothetical protein
MPPLRNLPGKGRDQLIEKVDELQLMLKSEKFNQLINELNPSLDAQQAAIQDINKLLKENGISVPQGVTFHVKENPASKQRSRVQVTMDIYFHHPGGNASRRA